MKKRPRKPASATVLLIEPPLALHYVCHEKRQREGRTPSILLFPSSKSVFLMLMSIIPIAYSFPIRFAATTTADTRTRLSGRGTARLRKCRYPSRSSNHDVISLHRAFHNHRLSLFTKALQGALSGESGGGDDMVDVVSATDVDIVADGELSTTSDSDVLSEQPYALDTSYDSISILEGTSNVDRSMDKDDAVNQEPKEDEAFFRQATTKKQPFFASPLNATQSTSLDTDAHNRTAVEQLGRGITSRRSALRYGGILIIGSLVSGMALKQSANLRSNVETITPKNPPRPSLIPQPVLKQAPLSLLRQQQHSTIKPSLTSSATPATKKSQQTAATTTKPSFSAAQQTTTIGRLEPVNLTQVASETNINVTMLCDEGCVSVDAKNYTKVQKVKVPKWYPSWLVPSTKVVKQISDPELLVASTVAGAFTEMVRTGLLYPLATIKVRVQQDRHNFTCRPPPLSEKIVTLGRNVQTKIQEGKLYAGIVPTLLVSVPATGIYYGFRDVTKRMLNMTPLSDTWIALSSAFVGDVVSLCFRTPADALALRLQAQNETVGDWLGDSLARLPMVIATDLPYLFSKIVLNRQFIHGSLSVDKYAELAIFTAVIAAFLTTPFDVARTRILLDEKLMLDDDSKNVEDIIWNTFAEDEYNLDPMEKDEPHVQIWNDHVDEEGEEVERNTPVVASRRPGYSVLQTMIQITQEGEGGYANLFAGWLERVLYLGIGRAWLEPVSLIGYIGIRDAVLLEWF